jgi:sortase (surface protein transpeptidase)
MLSMITCLFSIVLKINHKIDSIQQNQLLESEKMDSKIEAILHANMAPIVIVLESQSETMEETQSEEEHEPTQPKKEELQKEEQTTANQNSQQDNNYSANYYGRLYIPDANIDVGLYYGASQAICDKEDSANIFSMSVFDGLYIADHNNQEFAKLFSVKSGMTGYIVLANDVKFNIVCTDVLNGHNTGELIVNENGDANLDADFLMYTCKDNWKNILICLWKHC